MKCLIAIFALFVVANARSLPVERPIVDNPCTKDNLYTLRYFQSYPGDEQKYVECNPWGFYTIKTCDEGYIFNSWLMSCVRAQQDIESKIKEVLPTLPVEMPEMNETIAVKPICKLYGKDLCLNGGFCNIYIDGYSKCLCLSGYAGKYCEIEDPLSRGVFGEIVNKSFSLELYKEQRPLLNDTIELNFTMDASVQWDEETKQKISQYIALFPNKKMRFDQLITFLVEDFVSQLYPTSFYLQEFNYETEIETGLSGAIPNLLMTAKYSFDNFKNFMNVYDDILDNLVEYLLVKEKSIKTEAQMFYEVYDEIFKAIETKLNEKKDEIDRTDLSREEMIHRICEEFNRTLSQAYELYIMANNFDLELAVKGENYTTEQVVYAIGNFSLSTEVVKMMTEIHESNGDIWDSLSFYGFWYVLSSIVEVPDNVDPSLKQPYKMEEPVGIKVAKEIYDEEIEEQDDEELMTTIVKKSVMDVVTPSTPMVRPVERSQVEVPESLTTIRQKRMNVVTLTTPVKRLDAEIPVTTTTTSGVKRMDIELETTTSRSGIVERMDVAEPTVPIVKPVERSEVEVPESLTTIRQKRMNTVTLTTPVKRLDAEIPVTTTTSGVKRMDIELETTTSRPELVARMDDGSIIVGETTILRRDVTETVTTPKPIKRQDVEGEEDYFPEEEEIEEVIKKRVTPPSQLPEIVETTGIRLRDLVVPKEEETNI